MGAGAEPPQLSPRAALQAGVRPPEPGTWCDYRRAAAAAELAGRTGLGRGSRKMFSALKKLVGSEQAPGRDRNIPAGLQSMNQALQRRFAKGVQYNSECGPSRGRLRGMWGGWGPGRAAQDSLNPGSVRPGKRAGTRRTPRALLSAFRPAEPLSVPARMAGAPGCSLPWRREVMRAGEEGPEHPRTGGGRLGLWLSRLACGSFPRNAGPGGTGVRRACTVRFVQAAPGASAAP